MLVEKYNPSLKNIWNSFIEKSKNSTFLFNRNFMDYHNNRFVDYSLLVYERDNIIAVLPANIIDQTVYSHQGLTYGGIILRKEEKLMRTLKIVRCIVKFLYDEGIKDFFYKAFPRIYNQILADEIDYALFLMDAKLIRRDSSIVISQPNIFKLKKGRKSEISKAKSKNLRIVNENRFDQFWNQILIPNLSNRHGVKPVHTLAEISLLKTLFPENVYQYSVYSQTGTILAGTTLFLSSMVAHAQYIGSSEEGRASGALDYLFHELITKIAKHQSFFDLGICNEKEGRLINLGLLQWKESFGGRACNHDLYSIPTTTYNLLPEY